MPALRGRRWCEGRSGPGRRPGAVGRHQNLSQSTVDHPRAPHPSRPAADSTVPVAGAHEPSLGQSRVPPRPSFCRGVRRAYQRSTPRRRGDDGRCQGDFGSNPCCLWRRIGPPRVRARDATGRAFRHAARPDRERSPEASRSRRRRARLLGSGRDRARPVPCARRDPREPAQGCSSGAGPWGPIRGCLSTASPARNFGQRATVMDVSHGLP